MTYPLKFREHVLSFREAEGLTLAHTAERFGVGIATLTRWVKRIEPRKHYRRPWLKIDIVSLARYVGEERISVVAGTFDARHFQLVDTAGNLPEEHPPYNLWCTADDEYLFLRAGAAGYMQTHYELVELCRAKY